MTPPAGSCPDPDLLDALASGRLEAAARPNLERHLDACVSCSGIVAELARVYGSSVPPPTAAQMPTVAVSESGPQPASRTAPLFANVGRYKLIERIGEGGMGVVYVAHDPELDRRVALKLLRPDPTAVAEERRTRLVLEAQAMAKLSHPNVVTVHDVGRVGEQLFLAMELVEGVTLTRWLAEARRTRAAVIEVLAAAGRGLAAAHGAGLVHRDFKPDNVLVGRDGRVRVTDFGLARSSGTAVLDDAPLDVTGPTRPLAMTATGLLVGTPAYMAPEQWRGEVADAKSDQFAFAVALHEALFGVRPFEGRTVRELATNVLAGRMRPIPSAPRWLRALLERALAIGPDARFPSMDGLLAELGRDRDRPKRMALSAAGMVGGAAVLVTILHFATVGAAPSSGLALGSAEEPAPDGRAGAIPPRCEEERARSLAIWTEARREHLDRVVPKSGRDAANRLSARMQSMAAALGEARVAACMKKDDPLAIARRACLSDRHRAVEAIAVVLDGIDDPGPRPYADLSVATWDVPRPELCVSDAYLRARGSAYSIGDRANLDVALDEAAKLAVFAKLDRWQEADPIEKRLLADADSTSLQIQGPAVIGDTLFAVGGYRARRMHDEESGDALSKAMFSAKTAQDAETEARAAALLARVVFRENLDAAEADRWLGVAEARAGSTPELARTAAEVAEARGEVHVGLAEWVKARAALERALRLREEAVGADHPEVAGVRARLVTVLLAVGERQAALEHARSGGAAVEAALGPASMRAATQQRALGEALLGAGRAAEAVSVLEAARDVARDFAPIFHVETARTYDWLARADLALADFDGAETRVALGERQRENAPRRALEELAISKSVLAEVLRGRGDANGAVEARRAGLKLLEERYGSVHGYVALARLPLARDLYVAGDEKAALAEIEKGQSRIAELLGEGSAHHARFQREQGLMLLPEKGKAKRALELLDDAFLTLDAAWGSHHPEMGPLLLARAEAAEATGDREQSKRLAGAALKELETTLGVDHPETKRARALASLP